MANAAESCLRDRWPCMLERKTRWQAVGAPACVVVVVVVVVVAAKSGTGVAVWAAWATPCLPRTCRCNTDSAAGAAVVYGVRMCCLMHAATTSAPALAGQGAPMRVAEAVPTMAHRADSCAHARLRRSAQPQQAATAAAPSGAAMARKELRWAALPSWPWLPPARGAPPWSRACMVGCGEPLVRALIRLEARHAGSTEQQRSTAWVLAGVCCVLVVGAAFVGMRACACWCWV
eukprot:jgi/Ulvmu1/10998/UM007_0178.1